MTAPVLHQKSKKILIRLFLFVVGMMLCREIGVADAYWFQFRATGRHDGKQESVWDPGRSVRGVNFKFFQEMEDSENAFGFNMLPGISGGSFKKRSEPQIFREDGVTVSLDHLDVKVDGLYWLPIRKSADCTYVITYRVVAPDETVSKGRLEGKISFIGVGICSSRQFLRRIDSYLLKQIKTDLVKYLRERGAKKST